jgi:type IV pilus assembly protein PilY1
MATIDYQVGASADDAEETAAGACALTNDPLLNVDGTGEWNGWRFTGVTIPNGATIDVAYLTLYAPSSTLDDPDWTIYAHDNATPGAFTTDANNLSGRTRTTAAVDWASADLGAPGWFNTSSIVSIIQELMGSYSYASGAAMAFLATSRANDGDRDCRIRSWDYSSDSSFAGKLHIEYTPAAAGGSAVPAIMNSYRQRRA